ncbi:hypothetical protein [Microbacterium sulfonylureivorans]|uniref:hypothetical protein n=1 Tax=Microbacterium sulfonylureivorans TaxID=2486854 RepID=UPI00197B0B70|nr:hypothetical protein [Microbacterium sulfonylureivorans]
MPHDRRHRTLRALIGAVVLIAAAAPMVGCRPEPAPTGSATSTPSPSLSTPAPTPTATPTPTPTEPPADAFAVPAACEDIYSPAMIDALDEANPPLNDPGVTMLSTQDVDLIEIIESGAPTIRCSWGTPGEFGLATNVTVVDADQAVFVGDQLTAAGFGCESLGEGTVCRIEQKGVTLDDEEYMSGETHYVGGGGWVSTSWINFDPDGYTEDIVATLWG